MPWHLSPCHLLGLESHSRSPGGQRPPLGMEGGKETLRHGELGCESYHLNPRVSPAPPPPAFLHFPRPPTLWTPCHTCPFDQSLICPFPQGLQWGARRYSRIQAMGDGRMQRVKHVGSAPRFATLWCPRQVIPLLIASSSVSGAITE